MNSQKELGWQSIDLSTFTTEYNYGKNRLLINIWRLIGNPLLFYSPYAFSGGRYLNLFRIWLLRIFGAKIEGNVIVNPCRVYLPWRLEILENSWIGTDCEIYNLAPIYIGKNVCVSQKSFLCTGNHDYTKSNFTLKVGSIKLMDASWVGATSFIGPGVTLHPGSIVTAGSVVTKDVSEMTIVSGNPAREVRVRKIS